MNIFNCFLLSRDWDTTNQARLRFPLMFQCCVFHIHTLTLVLPTVVWKLITLFSNIFRMPYFPKPKTGSVTEMLHDCHQPFDWFPFQHQTKSGLFSFLGFCHSLLLTVIIIHTYYTYYNSYFIHTTCGFLKHILCENSD